MQNKEENLKQVSSEGKEDILKNLKQVFGEAIGSSAAVEDLMQEFVEEELKHQNMNRAQRRAAAKRLRKAYK